MLIPRRRRSVAHPVMRGSCGKHVLTRADGACQRCGEECCDECLITIDGRRAQVLCLPCALDAGGIRVSAARQPA